MILRVALGFSVACALAAAGLYVGDRASSSVPNTATEGQTLGADPGTMVDTAKAVTLIDQGKAALCLTTITGGAYFADPAAYVGQNWFKGLGALTLAQAISPTKAPYDTAGNALMLTTVTGKKYCSNRARYAGGYWAQAFAALASERASLAASPAKDGPSITIVR